MRELIDRPTESDLLHPRADQRNTLPTKVQAKVSVAKRSHHSAQPFRFVGFVHVCQLVPLIFTFFRPSCCSARMYSFAGRNTTVVTYVVRAPRRSESDGYRSGPVLRRCPARTRCVQRVSIISAPAARI